MRYAEYTGFTKTYVVCHNTGFGVQEAPYKEIGVVFETDNEEEAYAKAKELKSLNNSEEDLQSSWIPNTYHVNVNTLSEIGNQLLKEFQEESNARIEKGLAEGKYNVTKVGEMTYYTHKSLDEFFTQSPSEKPLQSSSFIIFNTSDNTDKKDFPNRVIYSKPKDEDESNV